MYYDTMIWKLSNTTDIWDARTRKLHIWERLHILQYKNWWNTDVNRHKILWNTDSKCTIALYWSQINIAIKLVTLNQDDNRVKNIKECKKQIYKNEILNPVMKLTAHIVLLQKAPKYCKELIIGNDWNQARK